MIRNGSDLLKASITLGVNPSSLRKIIAGKPVSKYWLKKLNNQLNHLKDQNVVFLELPKVKKLLLIYRLYLENGSLEKTGREIGLSRERIRQLLNKGTMLGLFDYKKIKLKTLPDIPKEKILKDYSNLLRLRDVARFNQITCQQLSNLLVLHHINRKTLNSIQIIKRKEKCVEQYFTLVKHFGRHPSTAELQKTYEGHYLSEKITRLWGSIHIFRKKLHISFKPRYRKKTTGVGLNHESDTVLHKSPSNQDRVALQVGDGIDKRAV